MLETSVVTPVSSFWVAEEAVTYFTKFKEHVDKLPYAVYAYFDSYRQALEIAYKNWLANTGGEVAEFDPTMSAAAQTYIKPVSASGEIKQLDISSVLPVTSTGDRGANTEELDSFVLTLEGIKESIISAIKVSNIEELELALVGGTQATSAETAFGHVYDLIGNLFDFLMIDDPERGSQSLKTAMEAVKTKYGDVATELSTIFDGFGSDSSAGTAA